MFGPEGLRNGNPTKDANEVLKGVISWSWSRQKRGGVLKIKNKDKCKELYEEAKLALDKGIERESTLLNKEKLKLAKDAMDTSAKYHTTLIIVGQMSTTTEEEIERVQKDAQEMINAMKGDDGK